MILSDNGNFPSDLYMARALRGLLDGRARAAHRRPRGRRRRHHRRGRGADADRGRLPHRAAARHGRADREGPCGGGADRLGSRAFRRRAAGGRGRRRADFAVGCTYKYLNGGPGAPAFIYVAPRTPTRPPRRCPAGWATPRPSPSTMATAPAPASSGCASAPRPMLQLAALDAALDVWDDVDMEDLRARSIDLQELFIAEVEAALPRPVACLAPRPGAARQPGLVPPPRGLRDHAGADRARA